MDASNLSPFIPKVGHLFKPDELTAEMNSTDLLAQITTSRPSHTSFLQSLAQAPSPNPPGSTLAIASVIKEYLTTHSIPHETIAPNHSMPNICASFTTPRPGPRLILNGHIDHFPPSNPSEWLRDPYSGELINDRIHGCGTVDMKAGTAASIIAYTYLYRFREFLSGSVGLCVVSDEETGGKFGSRFLIAKEGGEWRGDCMINAEPGGLGTIRFAEKGTLRLTFTVRTEGAHGAYTHRSASATRIAARLIVELGVVEEIVPKIDRELEEYMKREEVREAVDQAMGKGASDIMLKATLNIGVIQGGVKVNVIPDKCVFEADIRLPIGLGREEVLDCIKGVLERYPEVEMRIQKAASNPSSLCSHTHAMVDILARNGERIAGKKPVAIPSLGATDCKFWRYENVPAYVFGVSPEGMAMKDESVNVDEFMCVVKTHALAGWEYLGGEM